MKEGDDAPVPVQDRGRTGAVRGISTSQKITQDRGIIQF